jgi:hypothetical protein
MKLSEESKKIIKAKAKIFNKSESEILEWMISEYGDSTKDEKRKQAKRKKEARTAYLAEDKDSMSEKIWNHGFGAGWLHYQIRKSNHPFIKYKDIWN